MEQIRDTQGPGGTRRGTDLRQDWADMGQFWDTLQHDENSNLEQCVSKMNLRRCRMIRGPEFQILMDPICTFVEGHGLWMFVGISARFMRIRDTEQPHKASNCEFHVMRSCMRSVWCSLREQCACQYCRGSLVFVHIHDCRNGLLGCIETATDCMRQMQ